jgi:hypothetical protein
VFIIYSLAGVAKVCCTFLVMQAENPTQSIARKLDDEKSLDMDCGSRTVS